MGNLTIFFIIFKGTPCDLVTGEERSFADPSKNPSSHVACTVEMTSITTPCELNVSGYLEFLV